MRSRGRLERRVGEHSKVRGDSRFVSSMARYSMTSTVVDFDGSSVLNSSSLPSPRVFRVQHAQVFRKHDVFSSPRVF